MAIRILQDIPDNDGAGGTIAATVTAGSALIVHCQGTMTAVSDSVNGAWTAHQSGGSPNMAEYIFLGSAAGSITITATGTSFSNMTFREIGGFAGTPVVLGKSLNGQTVVGPTAVDSVTSLGASNAYQECFATAFSWSHFASFILSAGPNWTKSSNCFFDNAILSARTLSTSNVSTPATFYTSSGGSADYTSSITLWAGQAARAAWVKI